MRGTNLYNKFVPTVFSYQKKQVWAGKRSGCFGFVWRSLKNTVSGACVCAGAIWKLLLFVFVIVWMVDLTMRRYLIWTNFAGYEFLRENVTRPWRNNGLPAPIIN